MEQTTYKLSASYAVGMISMMLLCSGIVLFLLVFSIREEGVQVLANPLMAGFLLVGGIIVFGSGWDLYRHSQVRVNAQEIRRPGFWRPQVLRWDAVREMALAGSDVVLAYAPAKQWEIPLQAYQDSWAIITSCLDALDIQLATEPTAPLQPNAPQKMISEPLLFRQLGSMEGVARLVLGLGVFMTLGLPVLGLFSPPPNVVQWLSFLCALGFGVGMIGMGGWSIRAERRARRGYVRVTETAIARVYPDQREVALPWTAIAAIRYHPLGGRLTLRPHDGTGTLVIDADVEEFPFLTVVIYRKVQAAQS